MRLSVKVAGWFIFANMAMMSAPGAVVVTLGLWPLRPWLPPMAHDGGFNLTVLAGYLWPIGMPFVVWALDRWKPRWGTWVYRGSVALALYVWAILVTLLTLLMVADWVPMTTASGQRLQLDHSSDIKGTDADNNGIRDDIDAWIAAQPITDEQKKAACQMARAQQATLMADLTDKAALDQLGDRTMRGVDCLADRFEPDYQTGLDLSAKIEAITANTIERAKQYNAYNRSSSGGSGRLPKGDNCEP